MKVAAYCRVSTDTANQLQSYTNQQEYFKREFNKDCELYKIYADRGVSGTKLNRPEFDEMLRDAGLDIIDVKTENTHKKYITIPSNREPLFNRIYVKNTSRIARNIEVMSILNDLIKKKVYVDFLDIAKTTENQEDIMLIQLFLTFDENESRDKSKKIIFGHQQRNANNRISCGGRIYGYEYHHENNELTIIESEAAAVRKIFELYSKNYGERKICNWLREEKIFTRKGKPFATSTLNHMIQNEKYIGKNNPNKFDTGPVFNKYNTPKVREKYIVMDNERIPPIIDEHLFNTCQLIMKDRQNKSKTRGKYAGKDEYAGRIKCPVCGSSMFRSYSNERRLYYRCSLKVTNGKDYCSCKNIRADKIYEWIDNQWAKSLYIEDTNLKLDDIISVQWKYIVSIVSYMLKDNSLDVMTLQEEIDKLKLSVSTMLDLIINNPAVSDTINSKIEEVNKRITELNSKKEIMMDSNKTFIKKLKECMGVIKDLSGINTSYNSKEEFLSNTEKIIPRWINGEWLITRIDKNISYAWTLINKRTVEDIEIMSICKTMKLRSNDITPEIINECIKFYNKLLIL